MKKTKHSLFALLALTLAMQAGAAGFALNESSAAAAGTAYAGRGSNAEDASIMAANPAGVALLEERVATAGGGLVVPKGDFKGEGFGSTGSALGAHAISSTNNDFLKTSLVPFGYISIPKDEQVSFGFGLYAPFGAAVDYNDDWAGRYLADKTEVAVINLQPTVAYKFSNQLSVGIGVFISYVDGELSKFASAIPGARDSTATIKGDDWSYGWNIGAIWQPLKTTSFGISYRSSVKFTLRGDAKGTGTAFGTGVTEKAKLDITLPESVDLSLTHQFNDLWTVMAGATRTRWNRFDKLVIESDQGGNGIFSKMDPSDPNVITYVPENWRNTWSFAVGGSYRYDDQLTLKAGYAFDQTPVRDEFRTARIPDMDRNWLTVGAKYELGNDLIVDAAYGYMLASKVKINEQDYRSDGSPVGNAKLDGEYNNRAHVLSASVTKHF